MEEFKGKYQIENILTSKKEDIEIITSNIYRTIKEEFKNAENKGIEKGIKKGKVDIIIKQLSKKFTTVSDYYKEKLMSLDESVINNIALEILDMQSIEDLNKYITN